MSEKSATPEITISMEEYEKLLAAAKANADADDDTDVIDSDEIGSEEEDTFEDSKEDGIIVDETDEDDEESENLPAIIADDDEKALTDAEIETGKKLVAAANTVTKKLITAITKKSVAPLADIDARDVYTFFQAAQSPCGGEMMTGILDAVYSSAANGTPKVPGSSMKELAEKYRNDGDTVSEHIDSLIKWEYANSAFTGLDSISNTPRALIVYGANTLRTQIRMVGAIAYLRGYDVNDAKVKAMVLACLLGSNATQIVGKQASLFIKNLTQKAAEKIVKKVATKLGVRIGTQGMKKLGSVVPVVGNVVGSAVGVALDVATTYAVGKAAKLVFAPQGEELAEIERMQASEKAAEQAKEAAKAEAKKKEQEAKEAAKAAKAEAERMAAEAKRLEKEAAAAEEAANPSRFTKLKNLFKK